MQWSSCTTHTSLIDQKPFQQMNHSSNACPNAWIWDHYPSIELRTGRRLKPLVMVLLFYSLQIFGRDIAYDWLNFLGLRPMIRIRLTSETPKTTRCVPDFLWTERLLLLQLFMTSQLGNDYEEDFNYSEDFGEDQSEVLVSHHTVPITPQPPRTFYGTSRTDQSQNVNRTLSLNRSPHSLHASKTSTEGGSTKRVIMGGLAASRKPKLRKFPWRFS